MLSADNQELHTHMKKLRYRSWHRGCKETDIVLGSFAEQHLETLTASELALYERFLNENDVDIWDWLTGKATPGHGDYDLLLERLRRHSPP